jgi:RNA polymerase sigma-70 factor (ECF subfamily)
VSAACVTSLRSVAGDPGQQPKEKTLDLSGELEAFLVSVEKSAFHIARLATRDGDEALDIVQEVMIKLVRNYASRPAAEWKPLFYRMLNNRITDWHRRRAVRSKVMALLPVRRDRDDGYDVIAEVPDPRQQTPLDELATANAIDALEAAVARLPRRQREAFLLRNLEGLNVADTAAAMGCSTGSVKTHYSRAVHRLRELLGDHWS